MADLAAELRKIYAEHGTLRNEIIVDVARDPAHPLHGDFEWDDARGGEQYRLIQAGRMVRSVRVKFTDRAGDSRPIREFHSVVRDGQRAYEPTEVTSRDPDAMTMLLREMRQAWRAMEIRYGHLDEFWSMVQEGLTPTLE